jgi:hypothetical protein
MPIRPSMRENARFSGKADAPPASASRPAERVHAPEPGSPGGRAFRTKHAGGTAQDLLLYIMYIIGI